jgi:hypothetical protein
MKTIVIAAAVMLIASSAYAWEEVETAAGRTEAGTCMSAQRGGSSRILANNPKLQGSGKSFNASECSCDGNDRDGWVCEVQVSVQ